MIESGVLTENLACCKCDNAAAVAVTTTSRLTGRQSRYGLCRSCHQTAVASGTWNRKAWRSADDSHDDPAAIKLERLKALLGL